MNPKLISVSTDDGIVVQNEVNPNQLKKVRLINFIEPFITYGLVLLVMWVSGLNEDLWWMYAAFGVLLIWILILSPWWHYFKLNEKDIFLKPEQRNLGYWMFECRGLGSIKKYYQRDANGIPGFKKAWPTLKKITMFWDVLFIGAAIEFNQEYREYLDSFLGTSTATVQIGIALLLLIVIDVIMIFIAFPIMVRLDNIESGWNNQLRTMVFIGIPFVFVFNMFFAMFYDQLLAIFATNDYMALVGEDPFTRVSTFTVFGFFGQWSGYVAWGWLQQLLFLSVFSTQFARAFDLTKNPWAVYLAAFCSSFFFGLIHLPNFWLSLLTWIGGFIFAVAFMKNRNLMVMGIVHGMLGTLANQLLPVSFTVGPKSV